MAMGRKRSITLALAAIFPAIAAQAQTTDPEATPAAARRAFTVQPRVAVKETYTDNVRLASTAAQSDYITELAAGIDAVVNTARLKATFDYTATEVLYANSAASNRVLNALNTNGTFEAINNWAYLDFSGAIGQQAVSAFGTQSPSDSLINSNFVEGRTYRVSPYIRSRYSDLVDYELRLSHAVSSATVSGSTSDNDSTDANAKFSSPMTKIGLGWSVEASSQTANFSAARSTQANRVNLGVPYAFTPQFSLAAYVGSETNDYRSPARETYSTSGVGLTWLPSELTKLSALFENRSFGDAHTVSFEQRTARTAWRFSDVKDVSVSSGQAIGGGTGNVYDLLYTQFANVQPDPLARAQLVNSYLQTYGINPNAMVTNGYLTSSLTLQKRQELAFALLGIRDTISVIAMQSDARNLDIAAQGAGDLANGSNVQQRGINVNYAHRLTPLASVGLGVSQQVSSSTSLSVAQDSRTSALKTYFTRSLGGKAILNVELRRTVAEGLLPYQESAVTCSLNVPL